MAIYDQPLRLLESESVVAQPLIFDSFINPADPIQRTAYAELVAQRHLQLLFYDLDLVPRRLLFLAPLPFDEVREILLRADRHLATIPPNQLNYELVRRQLLRAIGP